MKNKKNNNGFFTSFSNSLKQIGKSGKDMGQMVSKASKDLPNLPWKKLPKEGYFALIVSAIGIIAIAVVYFVWLA